MSFIGIVLFSPRGACFERKEVQVISDSLAKAVEPKKSGALLIFGYFVNIYQIRFAFVFHVFIFIFALHTEENIRALMKYYDNWPTEKSSSYLLKTRQVCQKSATVIHSSRKVAPRLGGYGDLKVSFSLEFSLKLNYFVYLATTKLHHLFH
jgi:hypothetical protein